ncbi:efflux RND transporter periplasmic adaptor subunit [Stratiformator vulcanicus]|uniref:HlyD family secretion protein n=1 Tax=Stratiformator vulcanicus TaxID=2527980 RepID=A0A517QZH8_9PLAN|nr:HlyD family efflux transporter periplasmic adaptor subunit [Stratiformator vulcanicus]QDT36950.1 HlyD family secretion protein [Stratiformator vulcanicus]
MAKQIEKHGPVDTQRLRELEQIVSSSLEPNELLREFLSRLLEAVDGRSATAWQLIGRQIRLAIETKSSAEVVSAAPALRQKMTAMAIRERTPQLYFPGDGEEAQSFAQSAATSGDDSLFQPTIVVPLRVDDEMIGSIEVAFSDDTPRDVIAARLEAAEWAANLLCGHLGSKVPLQSSETSDSNSLPQETYAFRLQRQFDTNGVCRAIANEAALLLSADRVAVILKRGRRAKVEAVTGQETVHRRSEVVRALATLGKEVMRFDGIVEHDGFHFEHAPSIEKPLAKVVQVSGTRALLAVPLHEPERPKAGDDKAIESPQRRPPRVIGCLIIEWLRDVEPPADRRTKADQIIPLTEVTVTNVRAADRIPLRPVQRMCGKAIEAIKTRYRVQAMAVAVLLVVGTAACCFVPAPYRVTVDGELMPEVRRRVFAAIDGDVTDVHISGGDHVKQGQLLATLRNEELEAELIGIRSEIGEKEQHRRALTSRYEIAFRGGQREEAIDLQGQIAGLRAELTGLKRKADVLSQRYERLKIYSPLTGTVATFRVKENLIGRPVTRGEVLMEVMDETGPWRIELEVDEHRLGHVKRSIQNREEALPIEYLILTTPEQTYPASLERLSNRTVPSDEGMSKVDAHASLGERQPPLRIGADVRARIDCGDRSLGYVIFGDVIEFVRRYLWF